MNIFKAGWSPVLITALAIAGYINEWPLDALAPVLIIILIIGLVVAATGGGDKELERSSRRLKELAGYFNRRFAGNSSLSIFAIIDGLFNVDNPKLWDWARACDMSQRIFNTWCDSFISRVESDIRMRRFTVYLRTYLNELWQINSQYYEFVAQFYEIAEKMALPRETIEQYNRFVTEYNAFVQHFQEHIVELKKVARTEIEPPSVKLARELPEKKTIQATREGAETPPPPTEHKGYIM
jgi:hypothetical protein